VQNVNVYQAAQKHVAKGNGMVNDAYGPVVKATEVEANHSLSIVNPTFERAQKPGVGLDESAVPLKYSTDEKTLDLMLSKEIKDIVA